jgi:glycosyltransferase involved in cell wall biosynthesis
VTNRVLLTVSGTIPADLDAQIAAGTRPRPDYHAMAEAMGADLIDHAEAHAAAGRVARLMGRLIGANVLLAWACFRRRKRYDLIFTDGEQIGLPLAAMCRVGGRRGVRHFMIVHILTVRKKRLLYRALRLGPLIDRLFVYASRQRELIHEELGYPLDQIVLTTFAVDCQFWSMDRITPEPRRLIASAGLEFRDYPTLVEAVRGLDVDVVLAAASPWSKRRDNSGDVGVPANVTVGRLDFVALRQLYADATVVAVPLIETDFQAGITTILEAMSMAAAIVCTRTRGQTDTLVDGESAVMVAPGDAGEMRKALDVLLDDPVRRAELGQAARAWVIANADVHAYARRLAAEVDAALSRR